MKQFFLLCILAAFSTGLLSAQPLVLNQSNYAAVEPGDFLLFNTLDVSGVGFPARGEDMVWDYTGAQSWGYITMEYTIPDNSSFPTATVSRPISYSLTDYIIEGEAYEEINQDGHNVLGHSFEETSVELDFGIATGTLTVPSQNAPFYRREIVFPATYGSHWNTPDTRYVVEARLTALLYNNTPAHLVQHHITQDTVIGWGTLVLPDQQSYEVLLKKRTSIQIDSFYIDGAAASSLILSPLGLKQKDTTLMEIYTFHAAGIKGALLTHERITRQGETDEFVYYNASIPTSVTEYPASPVSSRLYPNPVTAGDAVVEFDKTDDARWSVSIIDMTGAAILTLPVTAPAGQVRIPLLSDASVANGAYRYSIRDGRGVHVGGGAIVLSR